MSEETKVEELDLVALLDQQTTLLATLTDEYPEEDIYDEFKEDRIKAIAQCFKVIMATQRALIKQIK